MIRGVHAIVYSLFDARERLDRAAMRRQVDFCLEAGVAGVATLGLASEVAKLTFDERVTLIRWLAEDVGGRVPIGVTIVGQSVTEQIALARIAEAHGADWLIIQPPAVGAYGAEEYVAFFSRVMEATTKPTAIQNAPQYLGRGLSQEDILQLRARHHHMTVIKAEGSAIEAARLVAAAGADMAVLNGRGGLEMIDCLDVGCSGFVLAPDLIDFAVAAMRRYDDGDRVGALALHRQCLPTILFIMQSIEHLICYGKRIFAARAGLEVHDRGPALRPTASGLAMLERHLRDLADVKT